MLVDTDGTDSPVPGAVVSAAWMDDELSTDDKEEDCDIGDALEPVVEGMDQIGPESKLELSIGNGGTPPPA